MHDDGGQDQRQDQAGPEQDLLLGPNTPPGNSGSTESPLSARSRRTGLAVIAGLVAVVIALGIAISVTPGPSTATVATDVDDPSDAPAPDGEQIVAPVEVSERTLAGLPRATTFDAIPGAPLDPAPAARTSGRIVHPATTVPLYARPGGPAIAGLPPQQTFGGLTTDTKVPVVAEEPGWAQVLLPSRPNSSTGWLFLDDPAVSTEHSRYRIVVDRARFTLALFDQDTQIGMWTIGVGKPGAITPAGRTFVLSSILDNSPKPFSPIVLPLGSHSDTHSTFAGGPGTVGIHTWPTASVYGQASSDGCVRVPPGALDVISRTVPLGSVVEIA
ncbi:L,D-transpeptidase [Amycolatopsis azurea]|uniref:L,D-transpeptidase n=1 Tax=Amycolatopsis azurea TaxID=36819 RepID=UPI0038222F32